MIKWLIICSAVSFLPVWRDVKTGEGLNIWEYLHSTAFTKRKHITPEEATKNYQRNTGYV